MLRVDERRYDDYIEAARECTANRVYPLSIATGVQRGDLYTNGEGGVLFWHACGFAYLSGTVTADLLGEVYQEFLMAETGRRFLLITDSESVRRTFADREALWLDRRLEYVHSGVTEKRSLPDDRFHLERITADNIGDIQGRIVPSFSWESHDAFLRLGFGFLIRCEGRFAAVAFSSAVSPEEVDIGIETHEDFRNLGLASFLACEMCEEIQKLGKEPVWAHAETNAGSRKTAVGAGFIQSRVNTVIRRKR